MLSSDLCTSFSVLLSVVEVNKKCSFRLSSILIPDVIIFLTKVTEETKRIRRVLEIKPAHHPSLKIFRNQITYFRFSFFFHNNSFPDSFLFVLSSNYQGSLYHSYLNKPLQRSACNRLLHPGKLHAAWIFENFMLLHYPFLPILVR